MTYPSSSFIVVEVHESFGLVGIFACVHKFATEFFSESYVLGC